MKSSVGERKNRMPRGPKGEKRPADVIGNAVRVMQIATGEAEDEFEPETGKDAAAPKPAKRGPYKTRAVAAVNSN